MPLEKIRPITNFVDKHISCSFFFQMEERSKMNTIDAMTMTTKLGEETSIFAIDLIFTFLNFKANLITFFK